MVIGLQTYKTCCCTNRNHPFEEHTHAQAMLKILDYISDFCMPQLLCNYVRQGLPYSYA